MCDADGGGGGGGSSNDVRGTEAQRGKNNSGYGNELGGFKDTVGGYIENNLPGLIVGPILGALTWGVGQIPDHMKSPGGPLGDSKQGSTPQGGAGDSAPRTVMSQAASAKADDQRRASRGKTVLTSPAIRKPSLTKKETLGTSGTLG